MADPLDLLGTTIAEKYAVESVVGQGGFAIVYRATHLIWKRPVAIKVFKSLAEFSEEDREKLLNEFIQEGALLADLSERSASIVQARDIGTLHLKGGEHVPFMVLEWLEGATLEAVVTEERRQALPLRTMQEAVQLLEPAAQALALAHAKGIAHRDVKPGNIFILGAPRGDSVAVKLLDFGIAKVVADAQKMAGAFSKTSGHVTAFTPAYGAPEQFSRTHGATGPWTDVFALSLILTELVTGKDVLEGDDFVQLAVASCHPERRPTPRTAGATVSDAVEQVFLKAVAIKPVDRYQALGDFWQALRAALEMEPARGFGPKTTSPNDAHDQLGSAKTQLAVPAPREASLSSLSSSSSTQRPPQANGKSVVAFIGLGAILAASGVAVAAFWNTGSRSGTTVPFKAATTTPAATPASASAVAPPPECPTSMVRVPGGKFYMGSDDKNDLDFERPAHQVTIAGYCIDKFEVTAEDYKACSDSGECLRASWVNEWEGIKPQERAAFDPLCNVRDVASRGKHPINCVDWAQASHFCEAHGKRLPTEAEWEFAARGPDGRKYPWGDDEPTAGLLNACGTECVAWGAKAKISVTPMYRVDDGFPATAPVGSFPKGASRYGVEDVVGNVWEWVADYYADYTADAQVSPKGPPEGTNRVIRGGAWNASYPSWVRPTFRYKDAPTTRSYGVGFRCARSISGAP